MDAGKCTTTLEIIVDTKDLPATCGQPQFFCVRCSHHPASSVTFKIPVLLEILDLVSNSRP